MLETASVLRHATRHSLVLLDELGRGTSTYDGVALAAATFEHVVGRVRCLAMLSTHYDALVTQFCGRRGVRIAHMATRPESLRVVPLYRLTDGPCWRSEGIACARAAFALCGFADSAVDQLLSRASEQSEALRRAVLDRLRMVVLRTLLAHGTAHGGSARRLDALAALQTTLRSMEDGELA